MDDALLARYKSFVAESEGLFAGNDEACTMISDAMAEANNVYAASDKTSQDRRRLAVKLKALLTAYQQNHCGRPHIIPPPGL